MHTITDNNLSHAWRDALRALIAEGGKTVHLAVAIARPLDAEDEHIRAMLDAFLDERRRAGTKLWPVSTVANTIFPAAFYRRDRENARARLYELHEKAQRLQRRLDSDSYFNRLVAYPGPDGKPFNQLEYIVDRLIKQRKPRERGGAMSSAYEVGLTTPGGDLRVQAPGRDRNIMSFPCLSQISFTLDGDVVNLAALYRNQYFVTRAYGNYLGLARIGDFIAHEVGARLGEVLCLATHADAQFDSLGKGRVEHLLRTLEAGDQLVEATA